MMKIKALFALALIVISTSGCGMLIPKYYVQNQMIASGDMSVEVTRVYQRDWVNLGQVSYYPPSGKTMFSVYLKITNNSKKNIKADLSETFVVEGKQGIGYSMLLQGKQFYPIVEMDPVKELDPGEDIERNLVFVLPKNEVPDGFVWKGVGAIKIPQAIQKKDEKQKG